MNLRRDYMAQWMSWIKSNDKEIIAILNDLANKAEESAKLLVELFVNFDRLNEIHSQIEKIEKEDISRIASKTDDIIDYIDGIVGRIIGFKIKSSPPYMLEIAKEIHNST